jgi:ADP-ribose pyrophosphatase YjhB (NUDIX family)
VAVSVRFCQTCGAELTARDVQGRSRLTCEPCGYVDWGHYSLGVGGVVVEDGRVLFVRDARGAHHGRWTLPGGYVEFDERFDEAAVREVREETGLETEVEGLLAVRHRPDPGNNTTYVAFRLRKVGGSLWPGGDGVEVDKVAFLAPEEMAAERRLTGLSRMIAMAALEGADAGLRRHPGTAVGVPHSVVYL